MSVAKLFPHKNVISTGGEAAAEKSAFAMFAQANIIARERAGAEINPK